MSDRRSELGRVVGTNAGQRYLWWQFGVQRPTLVIAIESGSGHEATVAIAIIGPWHGAPRRVDMKDLFVDEREP